MPVLPAAPAGADAAAPYPGIVLESARVPFRARRFVDASPLRPTMKVLFMSGYADDAILQHCVLSSELAFVQKPLRPAPLLTQLRVLDDIQSH